MRCHITVTMLSAEGDVLASGSGEVHDGAGSFYRIRMNPIRSGMVTTVLQDVRYPDGVTCEWRSGVRSGDDNYIDTKSGRKVWAQGRFTNPGEEAQSIGFCVREQGVTIPNWAPAEAGL